MPLVQDGPSRGTSDGGYYSVSDVPFLLYMQYSDLIL